MNDIIAAGIAGILAVCAFAALLLCAIVHIARLELQALTAGDYGFILASLAALMVVVIVYFGIGLWLSRTGRI